MKTTVDIADLLLEPARQIAADRGTTLRARVESGWRQVIAHRQADRAFQLRPVTFKGDGLRPELEGASWH